jgi:(hydroxyamino)benzene mutase
MKTQKRRLMWHGMLLFLLGLITGLLERRFTNVRMGLSAHLEGVLNGILLLALGAVWNEVRLPHPVRVTAYYTALYGTYANWLVTSIAAAFGTAANSPITSAGHSGQPWQESLVAIGFLTVTIAIIATSILVLWGLRGTAAEVNDGWRHSDSTFRERRKDADHEPGDRAALDAQSSGSIARQQTLA